MLVLLSAAAAIVLSQRYWFVRVWRFASRAKTLSVRRLLQGSWAAAFALFVFSVVSSFAFDRRNMLGRHAALTAWTSLWLSSALFAFIAAKAVDGASWLWRMTAAAFQYAGPSAHSGSSEGTYAVAARTFSATHAGLPATNPGRRHFVQAATIAAASIPFALGAYGFAFERFYYGVREIELPVHGLPPALAGLRIAQLSDIHMGSYMSAREVRRAVDMANERCADLTVITGDFITGPGDPLETCIAELARLRAPLGVWGCNGNHEIYAGVEALSAQLFERYGMRMLRQQCAELVWHGQAFNLMGVDYQREQDVDGVRRPMLAAVETLVRRDVPNILLSHNPNSFRRAAEMGIEVMLAGHTHGGQVTVEILDHRLSVARFFTPYIAGMYRRPAGAPANVGDDSAWAPSSADGSAPAVRGDGRGAAVLYVNRGLGTIGVPVRLGVPPEITLHTLRDA